MHSTPLQRIELVREMTKNACSNVVGWQSLLTRKDDVAQFVVRCTLFFHSVRRMVASHSIAVVSQLTHAVNANLTSSTHIHANTHTHTTNEWPDLTAENWTVSAFEVRRQSIAGDNLGSKMRLTQPLRSQHIGQWFKYLWHKRKNYTVYDMKSDVFLREKGVQVEDAFKMVYPKLPNHIK